MQLGGEGPVAHPGGVRLHHAQHVPDEPGRQAQARAHAAYAAVGRRHVRVCAWGNSTFILE